MPVQQRAIERRTSILDAAALVFARRGYAGASFADLIKESGLTKGAFYFHFASKEALALAVLRYKQEQWAGRVMAATMRHEKAIDQARAMVGALVDLHEQDPSVKAVRRLCTEMAEDLSLVPQLAPQFTSWIDMTASVMQNAQIQGEFREDVDPRAAAELAVGAFVGLEIMSEIISGGADLRERIDRYFDVLTYVLRPKE